MQVIVHMTKGKETKGTYVYVNDDEGTVITQLYIKKSAFKQAPETITVTIDG